MPRILLALFLSLLAIAGSAQVYRHVDEQGNVTFTDQPPAGSDAERVEIREPNIAAPPPDMPAAPPTEPKAQTKAGGYTVRITAPAHETIIPNGPGNFSVSASIKPGLRQGHQLQLKFDGAPRGEPQAGSSWALTNVFRGEHNMTVAVIDKDGKSLASSEPVTVFVYRPSSNFRDNSARPSHPIVRPPQPSNPIVRPPRPPRPSPRN